MRVWWRATLALAVAHIGFYGIVYARPGLPAVVLWQVAPLLIGSIAVVLLGAALVRSLRGVRPLRAEHHAGFFLLSIIVVSLAVFRTYPSSYDSRPSPVRFRLPLDGPVTVVWGGPTRRVNYHVTMPDQRWAYDLLVTEGGRSFSGDGSRLENYHAFGRPVLAPADGVVQSVRDGEPDGPIGQWRGLRAAGNHVVVKVAEDQYLFVAHLQRGSIGVRPGDRVEAGDVIGRVGNSGNSSEPHVHVHLQDTPTPALGEGIPLYFHQYRQDGDTIERGMPRGGRSTRAGVPVVFTGAVVEHVEKGGEAYRASPSHSGQRDTTKSAHSISSPASGRSSTPVPLQTWMTSPQRSAMSAPGVGSPGMASLVITQTVSRL
jgi:hypothetical protein